MLREQQDGRRECRLKPASPLQPLDAPGAWIASEGPVRFDLDAGEAPLPQGWVLVYAGISRAILDGSAVLFAHDGVREHAIDVPVSLGGWVYEVVRLPPGVRRLAWQPTRRAGSFTHTPVTLRALGPLERRWLMLRRIIGRCLSETRLARERVGLRWTRSVLDLEGQYDACARLRNYAHEIGYAEWLTLFDRLSDWDRRRIRSRVAQWRERARFALVVTGEGEERARTLASIEAQLYTGFRLLGPADDFAPTEYVGVLQAGDRLAEHALYWMAEAIASGGNVALAYADEDVIDADGRRSDPKFKPDWSPEHLRSINYVGRWALMRGRELAAAGGLKPDSLDGDGHELHLRVAAVLGAAKVQHVPALLFSRSAERPGMRPAPRARHPLPALPPLVSIVIPTRDRLELLSRCIESIERVSTWRHYEIVILDNQSRDERTLAYLAASRHRVVRYEHPFNFSAMINLGVAEARGEVVVLLNNDTEVITPDWLEEMLGHLHQPGVGAVGAKLLYSDGSVQHAGDTVGPGGGPNHLHNGIAGDAPGYCHRACVAQEVSAVTAACLMTWKAPYQRLGGLEAAHLPIAFSDVHYCLSLEQAAYRVVFTPHARLYHHESASRGHGEREQKRERRELRWLRRRWKARVANDPYYNPNLSYRSPDFTLSEEPRVRKPWLD